MQLANQVRYRSITLREARILNQWRIEYGVRGHGPKFDLRSSQWGYHMVIGRIHIRVLGKFIPL